MIHPLIPFAIRGAIWYQGEANLSDGMLYYHKMNALINSCGLPAAAFRTEKY
jgi:sialate O-acetylesterase